MPSSALNEKTSLVVEPESTHKPVVLPVDLTTFTHDDPKPRWYLGYGSNLASSTFRGSRGIKPLDQKNVLVQGLELTFDLPGVPYLEPRFANTRFAAPDTKPATIDGGPWTGLGALIGVAYLVTPQDLARVLASEGGGSSYKLVSIDAVVLLPGDSGVSGEHIEAYTLLAPQEKTRPYKGQPSLRYINIIRKGAREHCLPTKYIAYLDSIPHYASSTIRQKIGRALLISAWAPSLLLFFLLRQLSSRGTKTGEAPEALQHLMTRLFGFMWTSYSYFWRPVFGDGEGESGTSIQ